MSVTERLRMYGFWALDALRGQPVRKYYRDARDAWRYGEPAERTEAKLQSLLWHAARTTPFYAQFREAKALTLEDFPVMDKGKYRAAYDAFRSETYLHATDNRVMYTSGSTGTPFQMVQNRDKINHNTASALWLYRLGGYALGDRQAFARVWVHGYRKSHLRQRMENLYPFDATRLDDAAMTRFDQLLTGKRITNVIGYASFLTAFADYLAYGNGKQGRYALRSVLTISEHLPAQAREKLTTYLHCPVNSQYSNEENGVMAVQTGGEEYYVDSSGWHMEILKPDCDEPAADGELGRIVITDLYNYAFPMIRYDSGDMAVARHERDPKTGRMRLYLSELYGKRSDLILDKQGRPVSPRVITAMMHTYATKDTKMLQFQFAQKAKQSYCFRIVGDMALDRQALIAPFIDLFGEDIQVEIVDEIPVLASGKRKAVCNEMANKDEAM